MTYKVNELRTAANPDRMLIPGTFEDLLTVEKNGKKRILNMLDIPLGAAAINIPCKFE
jgi:hypothetical protein